MKTIILAAGLGSRLKAVSPDRPKAMLEIYKKTLIYYTITALKKNGVTDITMVLGYQYEKLIKYLMENFRQVNFRFIINPEYKSKENIYSLYLALRGQPEEDLLVINSDIFCEDRIIKTALEAPFNAMIVDADAEYTAEGTKVCIDEAGCISAVGKDLPPGQSSGEYIGILKLLGQSAGLYAGQIAQMVDQGQVHVWYPYALRQLLPEIRLRPIFTESLLWEEIDTAQDYQSAVEKAAKMKGLSDGAPPRQ